MVLNTHALIVCVLVLSAHVTALTPASLDCSSDTNKEAPKCKERKGTAKLDDSDRQVEALKDLLETLNNMSPSSQSGSSGSSATDNMNNSVLSATLQLQFVRNTILARQEEIEELTKVRIPAAHAWATKHFAMVVVAKTAVDRTMQTMEAMKDSLPRGEEGVVAQQQLSQTISRLGRLRDGIELASLDDQPQNLLQQSATLKTRLVEALRRVNDEDDVDMESLLELGSSLGSSNIGTVLQLIDHTIELLKQQRIRAQKQNNDKYTEWSDDMEQLQQQFESAVAATHWFHRHAMEAVSHSQDLRSYLKAITAIQFEALKWYSNAKDALTLIGHTFDATTRRNADTLPIFDQLLHMLQQGDQSNSHNASKHEACGDDVCGVCLGGGNTCPDCEGIANGQKVVDICGACIDKSAVAGQSCSYFCDHVANSGKVFDICGACDGDDQSCYGCDNVFKSGVEFDRCGVCGGDGKSCALERNCQTAQCGADTPVCPVGQKVTSNGFQACCFNPLVDCVEA